MEQEDMLLLNYIGVSNKKILNLRKKYPEYSFSTYKCKEEILKIELPPKSFKNFHTIKDGDLKLYKETLNRLGIQVSYYETNKYPKCLMNIDNPPAVLYIQGEYKEEDEMAIAIVGSRKCSGYGREVCEYFTKELAKLGISIISGLAYGIDSIAHKTALQVSGRTIAVVGNGLDITYPNRNKELYEIIPKNGVIFSEYPLGAKPMSYHFPLRNRIISGLSKGVLVVEAEAKSGTLITASYAGEQGKEIFAVPGDINQRNSLGTNRLIQDGTKLVIDVDDLLCEIQDLHEKKIVKEKKLYDLSENEEIIYNMLQIHSMTADELVEVTGLDVITLNPYLTILEMRGLIESDLGNKFRTKM